MRDVALPKCRIEQLPQVVLPIKQAKRQSTAGEVILKKPELELRGVWEQVPGVQALHTTEQEELPIGRPKAGRWAAPSGNSAKNPTKIRRGRAAARHTYLPT